MRELVILAAAVGITVGAAIGFAATGDLVSAGSIAFGTPLSAFLVATGARLVRESNRKGSSQ